MFGMPVMMRVPDVVGVRLTGRLRAGRARDRSRARRSPSACGQIDLADRFVEFFGPGVSTSPPATAPSSPTWLPSSAPIPAIFPIDDTDPCTTCGERPHRRTTCDSSKTMHGVRASGSIRTRPRAIPETIEIDLDDVEISLAGPRRPQDRIAGGHDGRGAGSGAQCLRGVACGSRWHSHRPAG